MAVMHTIRSAVVERPILHANFVQGCMFYRTGVIADGICTLRDWE